MNIRSSATFKPGDLARTQENDTAKVLTAVTNTTQKILDTALEKVPVKTGALQTSGHMTVTLEGQIVRGAVIFDAPYAAYVEFGTGIRGAGSAGAGPYPYNESWPGQAAQPFLRNSLDEHQDTLAGELRSQGF